MSTKKEIRHQFNKQAHQFSEHSFIRDQRIFAFLYDFCELNAQDILLDMACGSGDFIRFCSNRLKSAAGCDVSDALLRIAVNRGRRQGVENILLCQSDAEHVPFKNDAFSVVTCRSAFHHMENCRQVFEEMVRTVQNDGKVCIQDMTSYTDSHVNLFFEELDKSIDSSHHRALTSSEMDALFEKCQLGDIRKVEGMIAFNLQEYIGHAQQSEKDKQRIAELVEIGLKDSAIAPFFFNKKDELFFKKGGMTIVGTKR